MPGNESEDPDEQRALSAAYEERTRQLHDARGAVAEAVAALTVELDQRRRDAVTRLEEARALRDERDSAVADNHALRAEVEAQRLRIVALEEALAETRQVVAAFQHLKVVRWSAPARRIAYRLRARRR
jgi:uncharacterized coiled-coil DUF342 family protein